MLKRTSKEFRAFFLLEFTKQLIRHTNPTEYMRLQHLARDRAIAKKQLGIQEIPKRKIKDLVHKKHKKISDDEFIQSISEPLPSPMPINFPLRQARKPSVLRIPEPRLPFALRHLRPTPTQQQIDLERLNPFVKEMPALEIAQKAKEILDSY
ncbi:hypothetical protein ACFLZJ_01855, partial [Nanoarchaeota archaeon]